MSVPSSLLEKFRTARGLACQTMSYDRVKETRETVNERFKDFLIDVRRAHHLDINIGPLKDLEVAENKAVRDFDGRIELVTDFVRGKGVVTTPEEVLAIKSAISDPDSDLMEKHGIFLVAENDFFESPKDLTGYRALNYKLAVPAADGTGEYQVVELQIVAQQLEDIYDVTHPYKRRAEEIFDRIHQEGRGLTKLEKKEAAFNYAACRYHNGIAARDAAYDVLIKPDLRSRHMLTRNREMKLESMVNALDRNNPFYEFD